MSPHKITVELLARIANIGKPGDIIEISAPQARNFLIPKWMAREITAQWREKLEAEKKRSQDQARLRLLSAYDIQAALDGQVITFSLKWKWDKVFGGLDEHAISTRIQQKWGYDFEKKEIRLPNKTHIKTAGTHMVYVHITKDVLAKVFVEVQVTA